LLIPVRSGEMRGIPSSTPEALVLAARMTGMN
jgi:hypothetical protein